MLLDVMVIAQCLVGALIRSTFFSKAFTSYNAQLSSSNRESELVVVLDKELEVTDVDLSSSHTGTIRTGVITQTSCCSQALFFKGRRKDMTFTSYNAQL